MKRPLSSYGAFGRKCVKRALMLPVFLTPIMLMIMGIRERMAQAPIAKVVFAELSCAAMFGVGSYLVSGKEIKTKASVLATTLVLATSLGFFVMSDVKKLKSLGDYQTWTMPQSSRVDLNR